MKEPVRFVYVADRRPPALPPPNWRSPTAAGSRAGS